MFSSDTSVQPIPGGETVLCPRCDAGFQCGANGSTRCWCASVMIDDNVRSDLARFYNGCMCPSCLQELEDVRPPKPNVVEFLKAQLRRR